MLVPVLSLLEGESPPRVVQVYPLSGRDNLVGRAEWADVGIVDASVSREHVRIQQRGDGWVAVSLSGANPVKVDGRAVQEVPLSPGMVLQLGKVRVRFDDDDPRSQPTVIGTGIAKGLVPDPVPQAPASTPRHYDVQDTRTPPVRDRPDSMLAPSVWPFFAWGLLLAAGITLWVLREQAAETIATQLPSVAEWVDG